MIIDFAKAVDFLLGNGYLAVIDGKVTITGRFEREFRPTTQSRLQELFPGTISREEIFKKFIDDAKIPHKALGTDGKFYTIRQYSPGIADRLIQIIKSVQNYEILVESTKLYYTSNSFKKTFSNYIDQKIWKDEYERYEQDKAAGRTNMVTVVSSGGNKFED
jgi:hypothetical protein